MFVISGLAGGQTTPFFGVTIDFVVDGEVGCLLMFEALLNMKASANTVQPAATSTHTQFDADKIFKKDVIDSSQSCVEPAGHVWYFQDFCEMHYLCWLLFIQ